MDQLTPSELAQLRAKAALLTRSPEPVRGEVDFLAEGIRCELVVRGLWPPGAFLPIKKLAPDYHSIAPAVWNDLLGQFSKKLNLSELEQLGTLCGRALCDHIDGWPKPPLSATVAYQNVSRVFAALEESYPGYLRGGMLRILLGIF